MNAPRRTLSVDNDTPLRLADAIEIAFPRGGITVSGLRKEAAKVTWRPGMAISSFARAGGFSDEFLGLAKTSSSPA